MPTVTATPSRCLAGGPEAPSPSPQRSWNTLLTGVSLPRHRGPLPFSVERAEECRPRGERDATFLFSKRPKIPLPIGNTPIFSFLLIVIIVAFVHPWAGRPPSLRQVGSGVGEGEERP